MLSSPHTVTVELEIPEPKPVHVDPGQSALVIIDMQNEFCKPEGLMSLSPRRTAVVKPIQAFLGRCRAAGIPLIYVQSIRDPDSPEFAVFGLTPYVLRGSWGAQIADELAPVPGEVVVEKNSHDCFNHTRMEQVLAEKGITPCEWTVIVVGLGLTNCVSCAVSGFSVRNYRVVLPMDCTASRTREEELCQYQRFMQAGYAYNVTLTVSHMLAIGAKTPIGAPAG